MSLWNRIIESVSRTNYSASNIRDANKYAFVDVEVGLRDKRVHDIGALRCDGAVFHSSDKRALTEFLSDVDYLCGHNIIHHDITYLGLSTADLRQGLVDTLYVSPLLFPDRPYHKLLKNDKLDSDQMNNPVNDCEKARDLLMDELSQWNLLSQDWRDVLGSLLHDRPEFAGFLQMAGGFEQTTDVAVRIHTLLKGKICEHTDIKSLVNEHPCELAYALALIKTSDYRSITPPWVLHNYPRVEHIVRQLRHTPCPQGCEYCHTQLDAHANLNLFFGYQEFRTYDDEPLQQQAVEAAIAGKSLLAIFPTGGGKSLTFQLPALIEGRTVHGLTVVISPLLSLMKDQVDTLSERGITDAVTINGLLDPISRALAIQRVQDGDASLLYISPEMLRSKTIEKILLARHVSRFVVDEAHCFSSWGHDFRVDYMYIGKFIRQYQAQKHLSQPTPISCFTATAKQKVIQDICDYFQQTLGIHLELFASTASRTNLHYSVIHADTDEEKYAKLRSLISENNCPTIVYVSRTKRTTHLAEKLTRDGYPALAFNGRMDADTKVSNQDAFMNDQVRIIVATSAFGMGVDKKDVGLVVHYDISDSLENYVQEAGRAGRDPHLQARCFVLYSDGDLDKHFVLLNQTKLSISEIQQVWKAVKELTRQRPRASCSALEIARKAGWDDQVIDIETRVKTALAALEQSGYLERGNNVPHVYATGITVKNMEDARRRLSESLLFEKDEVEKAVRIIKSLISQKHIAKSQGSEAESRVDYLADILGLSKSEVVSAVERMRQEGILADSKDISAFLNETGENENKANRLLERFARLERYLLEHIPEESLIISRKQLNENAINAGITTAKEKDIRTLLNFLAVKGYTHKNEDAAHNLQLRRQSSMDVTLNRWEKRLSISRIAVEWLYRQAKQQTQDEKQHNAVQFSVVELLNHIRSQQQMIFGALSEVNIEDVEESLLYLSKIGAMTLEGGFMVLYNAMDIRRLKDNKLRYKHDDYRMLNEFYRQKIQQVHIVGEYANLMVKDYNAALQYVQDYFQMDYKRFVAKYFQGRRLNEIQRNITPKKYEQLFGQLSQRQMDIISNKESRCIVVAAGPGSGKTRVLVHKLASLLLMEDVKHEQLLMLTFSRAAATEFKQRLMELIGNAAHFVEIKTFHSYCFDLLGRIGNLDDAQDVVSRAAQMINEGEVEPNRIGKTVLVIDEAQDMGAEEYALINALMRRNEEMRVIAVGDDDQNIYQFRGSDSSYMRRLLSDGRGLLVEMTENYRSARHVVDCANAFVLGIPGRMKSTPIISMSPNNGYVGITHHESQYMYQPLVNELLQHRSNGTVGVLTQTNEEAVILVALLRRHGVNSKLVQSLEGFRFWNVAEVRLFLKYLDQYTQTPLIPESVWEYAKQKTFATYSDSTCLPYLQHCIALFEQTNKVKYITDFKEFVYESSVEDFCNIADAEVVVSTIHKSKGREFDDVFMLVNSTQQPTMDDMRKYYVGMTRAKQRLYIHTNSSIFNRLYADVHLQCHTTYDIPNQLTLQLSHRDVNLGYFKSRKSLVLALRSGNSLHYANGFLFNKPANISVAQLSQAMRDKLQKWSDLGYSVSEATVSFVVAWKPQDATKQEPTYAVLLADLTLTR